MKRSLASLILAISLLSSCAKTSVKSEDYAANSTPVVKLDVKKWELSNGLKLLVLEDQTLPIMSYYTFYEVGGRHEGPGTTGATHFLEHMMFRGSKNYPPQIFDSTIEKWGGSTNAYTNFDMTVYYESLPSAHLKRMIEMEADRVKGLLLLPDLVDGERKVVFEERKMRYENSPEGKLYLTMMQEVFKGTPYGGSVIGEVADLEALTPENLRSFHDRFYVPNNMVIVIAGDVDASEVHSLVQKNFGDLPASEELVTFKKEKDDVNRYKFKNAIKSGQEIKLNGTSPTPLFMYAFQGGAVGERSSYVMDILSSIIGDGESSWLNQNLVKGKSAMLSSVYAANYTLQHNGVFFIGGELANGQSLNRLENTLNSLIQRKMCKEAITERSVQKTKNQYLLSYFQSLKTNAGAAHFVGLRESLFGDYKEYEKEIAIYESITTKEVQDACEASIAKKNGIFLSIWDKHPRSKGSR